MTAYHHVAFFAWKQSTPPSAIQSACAALRSQSSLLPHILHLGVFPLLTQADIPHGHQINPLGYHAVMDMVFPSSAAVLAFANDPVHQALVTKEVAPHVEGVCCLDFPLGMEVDEYVRQQSEPHARHLVAIRPREGVSRERVEEVRVEWAALKEKIPVVVSTASGYHANPGYPEMGQGYELVVDQTFTDLASAAVYTQHPEHAQATPKVMDITDVYTGGLLACDWLPTSSPQ